MIIAYRLLLFFDHVKGTVKLFVWFCYVLDMQTYVGKQNWEKLLAIDFHISVTQCKRKYTKRKYTDFASKLLQIPTRSIHLLFHLFE